MISYTFVISEASRRILSTVRLIMLTCLSLVPLWDVCDADMSVVGVSTGLCIQLLLDAWLVPHPCSHADLIVATEVSGLPSPIVQ